MGWELLAPALSDGEPGWGLRCIGSWPEGGRAKPTLLAFSPGSAQRGLELFPGCMVPCSCPTDDFNPVCDASTHVEFLTPCHAGCANRVVREAPDKSQVGQASGCSICLSWAMPFPVTVCLSHSPTLNIHTLWLSVCLSPSAGRYRMLFSQ